MARTLAAFALAAGLALSAVGSAPVSAAPAQAGNIILQIDNPSPGEQNLNPNSVAGWVIDTGSYGGPGIDSVLVYADGDQTTGRFLGQAQLGGDRVDVAATYGNPGFRYSGFNFNLAYAQLAMNVPHTFTVVARATSGMVTSGSVSGVTLAPQFVAYQTQPAYNYQAYTPAVQYTSNGTYYYPTTTVATTPTYYTTPTYTAPTTSTYYTTPAYTYYGSGLYGNSFNGYNNYGATYYNGWLGNTLNPVGTTTYTGANNAVYYSNGTYYYYNPSTTTSSGSYYYPYGYGYGSPYGYYISR